MSLRRLPLIQRLLQYDGITHRLSNPLRQRHAASPFGSSQRPVTTPAVSTSRATPTRRPELRLDDVPRSMRLFPIVVVLGTAVTLCYFNYQKASSPIVALTLDALQTNERAREALGDEIYFARHVPWIRGEINAQVGRFDIGFTVKGTKRQGKMRYRTRREDKSRVLKTSEWSLNMDDGTKILLFNPGDPDPFEGEDLGALK